jgi:hypothetical protein
MHHRDLAEVGSRLKEAVRNLPDSVTDPPTLYDRYEMLAIQILDSEHADYPAGELEAYLLQYLAELRIKLGLPPL